MASDVHSSIIQHVQSPNLDRSVPTRIDALDGLRGFAISIVILYHVWQNYRPVDGLVYSVLSAGWIGVDLFFVLSGFLISGILLDARGLSPSVPRGYYTAFYARRFLRIFPLYYAYLAFAFVAEPTSAHTVVWFAMYAQSIRIARYGWIVGGSPLLGHLWSLSVEEQFYLGWPIVIALVPRRHFTRVCAWIVILALFARLVYAWHYHMTAAYVSLFTRADAFAIGACAACAYRDPSLLRRLLRWRWPVVFAAALVFGVVFVRQGRFPIWDSWMVTVGLTTNALLSALLLISLATADPQSRFARYWRAAPLRAIGKYSYAMYIVHVGVILALAKHLGPPRTRVNIGPFWEFTLIASVVTFAIAWCSWHVFEKHWIRLKRYVPMPMQELPATTIPLLSTTPLEPAVATE